MSRTIDAQSAAASQAGTVRPFLLVELDYPDGMVYATTLPFEVTLGGNVYYGNSVLGTVSPVEEGADAQSYGVQVGLAGVPGNFAAYLNGQNVQGRSATIKLGFCDASHRIIGTPTVIFVGRMDTQDVSAGKTTAVQVALESLLIDWERSSSRRYTDVDQRALYPDDRGLEFIAATVNAEFTWGR